ncbi:hypothetical protein [Streptomyces sp. CA-179760]|uniref:hypothetical protein n=1 Tax=Streptomyces sp. CA-179760 TaxID=3240054 RepID=UPI003D8EDDC1
MWGPEAWGGAVRGAGAWGVPGVREGPGRAGGEPEESRERAGDALERLGRAAVTPVSSEGAAEAAPEALGRAAAAAPAEPLGRAVTVPPGTSPGSQQTPSNNNEKVTAIVRASR